MSDKLKPCPFCGDPDLEFHPNIHGWKIVQCCNCGACGPCIELDDSKAKERWNERAAQPQNDDQWNKKLADDLERLCCAETEAKFFDLVTDSIQTIIAALRRPAQPQNDAEAVAFMFWNEPDTQRHFSQLRETIGSHWENVVPLYTAPPSPERMREALEELISDKKEQVRTHVWVPPSSAWHRAFGYIAALNEALEALRAGDNHASNGKESEMWPSGCFDPDSCARHRTCMYALCKNQGRDVSDEVLAIRGGA